MYKIYEQTHSILSIHNGKTNAMGRGQLTIQVFKAEKNIVQDWNTTNKQNPVKEAMTFIQHIHR